MTAGRLGFDDLVRDSIDSITINGSVSFRSILSEFERNLIFAGLANAGGDPAKAAAFLDISEETLLKKISKLGISNSSRVNHRNGGDSSGKTREAQEKGPENGIQRMQ